MWSIAQHTVQQYCVVNNIFRIRELPTCTRVNFRIFFFFVCASQQLSLVNERYTHFRRTPPFWFILPSYFCMLHSSKKKLIHSGNFPFLLCLLFMYQTLPAADVMSWILLIGRVSLRAIVKCSTVRDATFFNVWCR